MHCEYVFSSLVAMLDPCSKGDANKPCYIRISCLYLILVFVFADFDVPLRCNKLCIVLG